METYRVWQATASEGSRKKLEAGGPSVEASAMPFGTAQLTTLAAAALRSWPSNRTLKAGELWTGHDGPTVVYAVRRLG